MTLREFFRRLPDLDFERRHALAALAVLVGGLVFLAVTGPVGAVFALAIAGTLAYARLLRAAVRADLAQRDSRRLQEMWVRAEAEGVDAELRDLRP